MLYLREEKEQKKKFKLILNLISFFTIAIFIIGNSLIKFIYK